MTSLFDQLPPAAASADPISSKLAAAEITKSGARRRNIERVADLVSRHPGRTSRELSICIPSFAPIISRHEIARRLKEAETLKLVKRGAMRKCRLGRRLALTWWPCDGSESYDREMEV